MEEEIEKVKMKMKEKRNRFFEPQKPQSPKIPFFLIKFLLCVVVTLISLILLKSNAELKKQFYRYVYDTNFSFASINQFYQKHFGSPIPFLDILDEKTKPVFNEKLVYSKKEGYQDGVKLIVDKDYLVPALESGMVVFIGEKEGYGKTVIVQQIDGVDVWYGNVAVSDIKLYDYIEKGSFVGEADQKLYLVFKKDGKVLKYEDYL